MTDDEKLASPSFEDMDAGAIFGSDAIAIDDGASIVRAARVRDDHHRRGGPATNEEEDRYVLVAHRFFEQVRFSAVGHGADPQRRRSRASAIWTCRRPWRCAPGSS